MNGQIVFSPVEVAVAPEVSGVEMMVSDVSQPIKLAVYEKRRWPYLLTMPISWLLTLYVMAKKKICQRFGLPGPKINTLWFDGLGQVNRSIKDGAASWKALDIIYNYRFGWSLTGAVDNFWVGMMNAQAVRNRFKLVRQEVRRAISKFSDQKEIRLISLACGSAQAVIEIIAEFKVKGLTVKAILVDIDPTALDYARDLAKRYGVISQIEIRKSSVALVAKIARDFRPHVIEMLGLLDYIEQDKATRLAGKIYESLEPKGIFLTCNIAPNIEQHFLKWVINWSMIYRSPVELAEIATIAGFSDYRLIYEPLKIHGVLIAQKVGGS